MGGEGVGIVTGDPWVSDIRSRINGEDGSLARNRFEGEEQGSGCDESAIVMWR